MDSLAQFALWTINIDLQYKDIPSFTQISQIKSDCKHWHYNEERKELLVTRENKDEEGADSSDDADDLAHVGDKHGSEDSDTYPDHSENESAAALKGMSDYSSPMSLKTQNQVQDDRPVPEMDSETTRSRGEKLKWENTPWPT